jgi:hypothetical protein
VLPADAKHDSRVEKDLVELAARFEASDVWERLLRSVQLVSRRSKQSTSDTSFALGPTEAEKLLMPFQQRLSSVFMDLQKGLLVETLCGTESFLNLFAVVRYVPTSHYLRFNSYNYTARLLLTAEQQRAIETIAGSGGRRVIEELQAPVGRHARTIADSAFTSGVIDFGPRPLSEDERDCFGDTPTPEDEARRTHERWLYKELRPLVPTQADGRRILYVPIHVGGTPWVALFTFVDVDKHDQNISFYRDALPAAAIRDAAEEAFVDVLAEQFGEAVRKDCNRKEFIDEVNSAWVRACAVYPFRRPIITDGRPPTNAERLGTLPRDKAELWMYYDTDSSPWRQQVDYHLLDIKGVASRLRHALAIRNEEAYRASQMGLGIFGHAITGFLQRSGAHAVRQRLLHGEASDISPLDLRQLAFGISPLWALAEMTRLLYESGTDVCRRWIDANPRVRASDTAAIGHAIAHTCRAIIDAVVNHRGAQAQKIGLREYNCTSESVIPPRAAEPLWPFRGSSPFDSPGTLVATLGLWELLRNAVKYVDQKREYFAAWGRSPELGYSIDETETGVRVRVFEPLIDQNAGSRTISVIQSFERQFAMYDTPLVRTTDFATSLEHAEQLPELDGVSWVTGEWCYEWKQFGQGQWR